MLYRDGADRRGSASAGKQAILYYRNPMGLPDISPTPKKDSMGMDYIPVYESEDGRGLDRKDQPWQAAAARRAIRAGERRTLTHAFARPAPSSKTNAGSP